MPVDLPRFCSELLAALARFPRDSKRRIGMLETLEPRRLFAVFNPSFDVTDLTQLRSNPNFASITGSGIGIAVLDTGVYALNPDLSGKVAAFYNAVSSPLPSTIGAGSVSAAVDRAGHGTHVSGTAASADPDIGVAYGATLVNVKVIADTGETRLGGDPLLRGLQFVQRFANQFNIKVVNMSLGNYNAEGGLNLNAAPQADDIARQIDVLEGLGITVVSASGNSYANDPALGQGYPAVVSTIGVASTWSDSGSADDFGSFASGTPNDSWAAFENSAAIDRFSATSQRSSVDNQVAAPGVDIFSDWNNSSNDNGGNDLLHNTLSGTSMAAPFVSGVVALIQQAAFTFGGRYITDPQQVLSIIKSTSEAISDTNVTDNGRVRLSNGQLVSSQTFNLPETGATFDRVNVLQAIQAVKALFSGTASNDDTDNTAATATAVPSIDGTAVFTQTGEIGTDGLNQVGPNDVDVYQLTLTSPGALSITTSLPTGGSAFIAAISLFDADGNEIDVVQGDSISGYPTLTAGVGTALDIGTYYVGISSGGNVLYQITDGSAADGGASSGDYAVTFSLSNPDPNGVAQGAANVDLTSPNQTLSGNIVANFFNGDLGSDPPPTGSTTRIPVPNGDVDMFKVVAPDTGTLTVRTDTVSYLGTAADTYLRVFDANFQEIAFDDDGGPGTDSVTDASIVLGQTYYVAVTNFANSAFDAIDPFNRVQGSTAIDRFYDVFLSFDNGDQNGTALLASNATIGATISDAIGSDDGFALQGANGGFKDVDWYTLTPAADGLLDIAATGDGGFTPNVQFWRLSDDRSSISQVGGVTGSGSHLIDQVTAGQTVYVSVTGRGNQNFNWFSLAGGSGGETGSYSLVSALRPMSDLAALDDGAINGGTPQTITGGNVVSDNLGQDSGLIVGASDVDLYQFVPTTTGRFDIRTDTSQEGSADTLLRLFDISGNQITSSDNASSATTASFIRANLVAGETYYIGVSGTGNAAYSAIDGTGATVSTGAGSYGLAVRAATVPAVSVASPAPVEASTARVDFVVSLDFAPSASLTVDYTTADGSATAGIDYTATSGTIVFAAGETIKTISVPLLVNPAASGSLTFAFNLINPSSNAVIAGGQAQGTIVSVPVTTLQLSARTPVAYNDATGRRVVARLNGPGAGSVAVVGSPVVSVVITVTGTTAASSLAIGTAGGLTVVNGLQVNGSLATLIAPQVDLQGDLTVTGSIRALRLARASGGHTLSIQGNGAPAALVLGNVSNLTVSIAQPIAVLVASSWLSPSGTDVITAPSIGALQTTGDFAAGLQLGATGVALRSARIGGATSGRWDIAGSAGAIVTGSAASTWAATFGGSVNALAIVGDASGSVTAKSIRAMYVRRNLAQANITLTGATSGPDLGTLIVGGTNNASSVTTHGNINAVRVGAMIDATIRAGVDPTVTGLPTAASAFNNPASIFSFVVTGLPGLALAFSNSIVAAQNLGTVIVNRVQSDNAGTAFGFAAATLKIFGDIEPGARPFVWTTRRPVGDLTFNGDFRVALV